MSIDEVRARLVEVFRQVFDDPSLNITDATTARDVEGWDSLAQINIVLAVEKSFGVKLTTREIQAAKNVGEFVQLIAARLGRK